MFEALGWLRNSVDYTLRRLIRLSRPGCTLPAEPKEELFGPDAAREAERLVDTYHLQRWAEQSGRTDFAASLFYLQALERALGEAAITLPAGRVEALDAGCGDWFYVPALHGLLAHYGGGSPRAVALDGVEVDAWALYAGFRSRYDWAQAYAAGLDGARYLAVDLRTYQRPVDIAFMLFPFLFAADLRRWGLPRRFLRPADYLAHVWAQVRPGGALLIANLGEAERDEQHRLLREGGIAIRWSASHRSPLFTYQRLRYLTVAVKEGPAHGSPPDSAGR